MLVSLRDFHLDIFLFHLFFTRTEASATSPKLLLAHTRVAADEECCCLSGIVVDCAGMVCAFILSHFGGSGLHLEFSGPRSPVLEPYSLEIFKWDSLTPCLSGF